MPPKAWICAYSYGKSIDVLQKPSETLNTLRAIYNYDLHLLNLPLIHTLTKYQFLVMPVTVRLLGIK